ncbi:MAG: squalene synthase HpnC [Acidobacteria bacterium]|nr:squalene synthase HpnC [Acidobacteriota bacterium]
MVGARSHYENFPVASILLPQAMRRHVAAVYAFARAADDFADEGDRLADQRRALLDGWRRRLCQAASSADPGPPAQPGEPPHTVAIFLALGASIRARSLPVPLFEDLLSAFQQDVTVTRYPTWEAVLDYCRRSANPIGRLVLRIAGYRDERLDAWSDAICTALQLTNFWQDLHVDFTRGRVYLPEEVRQGLDARDEDLAAGRVTPAWQRALAVAARRTRARFDAGAPLCDAVHGRLRYELRATWLGGVRILARLERIEFDVVRRRPTLGVADAPWIAWRMLTWP